MKQIIYKTPKQTKAEVGRIELIQSVLKDFEDRKQKRMPLELQWRLNQEFLNGNQNTYVTTMETLASLGKQFHWQQREVFNHIAPLIESRLARLFETEKGEVRSEKDRGQIASAFDDQDEKETVGAEFFRPRENQNDQWSHQNFSLLTSHFSLPRTATTWSETTGTAFYKIVWKNNPEIIIVSPFEIYPDNLEAADLTQVRSLIHAKELTVEEIDEIWGIDLRDKDKKTAMVIERYEIPTKLRPNGRLIIIAGDKLAHDGELPFINGEDGSRTFPFVRQTCEDVVGGFFGRSVIERAIPVQRAYNAVKNRKAEFMARLACGVLAVEDGSVDMESLESEGLAPGKVITYRQGMSAPTFLDPGTIPAELGSEEEKLLSEFEIIAGGDITRHNVQGAHAMELLMQKSAQSLARTRHNLQSAIKQVEEHVERLEAQFGN